MRKTIIAVILLKGVTLLLFLVFFVMPFDRASERFNEAFYRNDLEGMRQAVKDECAVYWNSWSHCKP